MKKPVLIASILLILAGAFGNYLRYMEHAPDRPADFSVIPLEADQYIGEERRFADYSYDVLQADTTTLRRYIDRDGLTYWLFLAYFNSQKYGSQIHSPKHCLPGGGWHILRHDPYDLKLPGGVTKHVNLLVIAERSRQQLMLYWFETRTGAIRNEFGLKWDLVRNSLFLQPTDATIVRLTIPIGEVDGLSGALARAERFFAVFQPSISRALPFGH